MDELTKNFKFFTVLSSLVCMLAISTAENEGCGDLPKWRHISPVNPGNAPFEVNTRIAYQCDIGYKKVQGTTDAICEETGWTKPSLTCVGMNCGDPGHSPHASRKGTLFTFPNNLTYTCDEGYKMKINRPTIFCLANERWSASVPECEIIICPLLPQISNGGITYSETDRRYQSIAEYSCNTGFIIRDFERKRRCTSEGKWDGGEPVCGEVRCDPISSLKNGRIIHNANATAVNALVILQCNAPDYFTRSLKCLPDGTWSEPIPVCGGSTTVISTPSTPVKERPTTSKPEDSTENGKNSSQNPKNGLEHGKNSSQNTKNLLTGPGIPCEDPGAIENGHLIDKIIFPTNQSIAYGCKEGFTVSGTGKLICQRDGTWSPGTMPKCNKRLSIEIIAGIAVGVVSVLILVVVGVIFYLKKKKKDSIGNPGLKNKALSVDAKHVDEIRHLDKDKKPIPVTSL